MARNLIIVESPAKSKTIKKFLISKMILSRNILQSEEKVSYWLLCERKSRRQIKFISQLTPTVRERQFPGIYVML